MNVIKNEDNNSGADSLNAVLSVTEAVAVRSKKAVIQKNIPVSFIKRLVEKPKIKGT